MTDTVTAIRTKEQFEKAIGPINIAVRQDLRTQLAAKLAFSDEAWSRFSLDVTEARNKHLFEPPATPESRDRVNRVAAAAAELTAALSAVLSHTKVDLIPVGMRVLDYEFEQELNNLSETTENAGLSRLWAGVDDELRISSLILMTRVIKSAAAMVAQNSGIRGRGEGNKIIGYDEFISACATAWLTQNATLDCNEHETGGRHRGRFVNFVILAQRLLLGQTMRRSEARVGHAVHGWLRRDLGGQPK